MVAASLTHMLSHRGSWTPSFAGKTCASVGTDLGSIITAKMAGLTDPGAALDLFSLGGTNGGMFTASAFWDEATKYFNKSA